MSVKRIQKYIDGSGTFKAAATMSPGELVYLSAAGTVTKATAGGTNNPNYIGIVDRDEKYIAANGTDVYAANALVPVVFRGKVFTGVAASPVTVGAFILQAASGLVANESTTTIATAATIGIALNAGTTSAEISFVTF